MNKLKSKGFTMQSLYLLITAMTLIAIILWYICTFYVSYSAIKIFAKVLLNWITGISSILYLSLLVYSIYVQYKRDEFNAKNSKK